MTEQELDRAMMRDVQLHESVRIVYIVEGWAATFYPQDDEDAGGIMCCGATPMTALRELFSTVCNTRGRTS